MNESLLVDQTPSVRSIMRGLFGHSPSANSPDGPGSTESLGQSTTDVEGWITAKLRKGKCSTLLVGQLAQNNMALGVLRDGARFYFEPNDIYAAIEKLETGVKTRGRRYRRGLLRGLSRVHHNSISFLVENALQAWDQKVKSSRLSEDAYLASLISVPVGEMVLNGLSRTEAALQAVKNLVYKELVGNMKGLFRKAGGWLVYVLRGGSNYYLTLAFQKDADTTILDRLKPCFEQYDFLKESVGTPN